MSFHRRTTLRTRSKDAVMALAFSSDDSLLAASHFDGTISIFDTQTHATIQELNALHVLKPLMEIKHHQREKEKEKKRKELEKEHGSGGSVGSGNSLNNSLRETSGKSFEDLESSMERQKLPVTCMAFRPNPSSSSTASGGETSPLIVPPPSSSSSSRPILLFCTSNGFLTLMDASSQEILNQDKEEHDNEIYCCAWNSNGQNFATAGRDAFVRVYNFDQVKSGAHCNIMKRFTIQSPSASTAALRIYSLAWHPAEPNIVFAGGWSRTVTKIDVANTREGLIEPNQRQDLFGPILSGDAMVLIPRHGHHHHHNQQQQDSPSDSKTTFDIFTASHRLENRLELFDSNTMSKIVDIKWPNKNQEFLPLCAAASSDGHYLAFGGGGGQNFQDGAIIVSAPNGKIRDEAAQVVALEEAKKKAATTTTTTTNMNLEDSIRSSREQEKHDVHYHQHEVQRSALELLQPSKPVCAIRFSGGNQSSTRIVALGDSEGLVHLYEKQQK